MQKVPFLLHNLFVIGRSIPLKYTLSSGVFGGLFCGFVVLLPELGMVKLFGLLANVVTRVAGFWLETLIIKAMKKTKIAEASPIGPSPTFDGDVLDPSA